MLTSIDGRIFEFCPRFPPPWLSGQNRKVPREAAGDFSSVSVSQHVRKRSISRTDTSQEITKVIFSGLHQARWFSAETVKAVLLFLTLSLSLSAQTFFASSLSKKTHFCRSDCRLVQFCWSQSPLTRGEAPLGRVDVTKCLTSSKCKTMATEWRGRPSPYRRAACFQTSKLFCHCFRWIQISYFPCLTISKHRLS